MHLSIMHGLHVAPPYATEHQNKKSAHTTCGKGVLVGLSSLQLKAYISSARGEGPFFFPVRGHFCSAGQGGLLFGSALLGDFWLRCAVPAMGISVLEEILVFDWFFASFRLRLEGHWGERFGDVSLGSF